MRRLDTRPRFPPFTMPRDHKPRSASFRTSMLLTKRAWNGTLVTTTSMPTNATPPCLPSMQWSNAGPEAAQPGQPAARGAGGQPGLTGRGQRRRRSWAQQEGALWPSVGRPHGRWGQPAPDARAQPPAQQPGHFAAARSRPHAQGGWAAPGPAGRAEHGRPDRLWRAARDVKNGCWRIRLRVCSFLLILMERLHETGFCRQLLQTFCLILVILIPTGS